MLLADLVGVSAAVRATRSRIRKRELLADTLRSTVAGEVRIAVSYLSGELPQGRVGLGYATVYGVDAAPAERPSLSLQEVDSQITDLSLLSEPGSNGRRTEALEALLGVASAAEQAFLRGLLLRELRQGALENSMAEALAIVDAATVQRAVMLSGDLSAVAETVLTGGADGLASFRLTLFRPIKPMLAGTAEDVGGVLARHSPAALETKIDGARIQVHRQGDKVAVYTRNLREVTDQLPEVVATVRSWDCEQAIVDGEVIALQPGRTPEPFQVTMSRFGTRRKAGGTIDTVPLTPFFFDCLLLDGEDLIDDEAQRRREALETVAATENLPPRIVTDDVAVAQAFYSDVLETGHEGVMVKSLSGPYGAGRRGAGWLKVKPAHTLDLVVIAVEWGSGRRTGWLSNLHLGALDPATSEFVMLGKTFKGLTDETLAWQTERFLDLESHRDGHVVHVRPEQVVEIAFDGIQQSSRYPGGMALRFAKVKGYRDDKPATEADTIETVASIFNGRPTTKP